MAFRFASNKSNFTVLRIERAITPKTCIHTHTVHTASQAFIIRIVYSLFIFSFVQIRISVNRTLHMRNKERARVAAITSGKENYTNTLQHTHFTGLLAAQLAVSLALAVYHCRKLRQVFFISVFASLRFDFPLFPFVFLLLCFLLFHLPFFCFQFNIYFPSHHWCRIRAVPIVFCVCGFFVFVFVFFLLSFTSSVNRSKLLNG